MFYNHIENQKLKIVISIYLLYIIIPFNISNSFGEYTGNHSKANAVIVLNKLTTEIGLKEKLFPPVFTRSYSLVHISIYDSLLLSQNYNDSNLQLAAITNTASGILNYLFPEYSYQINKTKNLLMNDLIDYEDNSIMQKGLMLGEMVSQSVINYSNHDNSKIESNHKIPKGECIWKGINPVLPMADYWKTHMLKSGA